MMNSVVTVGLVVKNCEKYIKDAVTCILEQDFPHDLMELIVVDGYSQDNTIHIIKDGLSKTDLKCSFYFENKGLGEARQIVVDKATTEYILWLDGDMTISKDFIRKQVEFMDKNPKAGIAKGRHSLKEGANLLATLEIYARAASKMVDFNAEKTSRFKSLGTSGCIYRVKAIRQAGGFDDTIKGYGEDLDAEIRVKDAGWQLFMTAVTYQDYERKGIKLNELWRKYIRRGYDMHLFSQKHVGLVKLSKMSPPAAFVGGLFQSFTIYRLTNKKSVFLLPVQCALKNTAWCIGFATARLESKK
jgi:glycosyltransferase involved in cell wall biosynthesis